MTDRACQTFEQLSAVVVGCSPPSPVGASRDGGAPSALLQGGFARGRRGGDQRRLYGQVSYIRDMVARVEPCEQKSGDRRRFAPAKRSEERRVGEEGRSRWS